MNTICSIDVDNAESAAVDIDGEIDIIYFDATEAPQGWVMSLMVDCNSGGFCDSPIQDDGPYLSRDEALFGALNFVFEWMADNHPQADIEYTPHTQSLICDKAKANSQQKD